MQTEDGVTVWIVRLILRLLFGRYCFVKKGRQYEANVSLGKIKDIDKGVNLFKFPRQQTWSK